MRFLCLNEENALLETYLARVNDGMGSVGSFWIVVEFNLRLQRDIKSDCIFL